MDAKEIIEKLKNGEKMERIIVLSNLDNTFNSYNKNIKNFNVVVQWMVNYVAEHSDDELADDFLGVICIAEIRQDVTNISFDIIEQSLHKFSGKELARCIDILSYTDNKGYLSTILKYKDNDDEVVRQAVKDAIFELTGSHDLL